MTDATIDVVGVFDSDFNQLFQTARPVRCNVVEDSTMFKHPLETGYTITDHRIIMPIEINMIVKLPQSTYRDVYNSVRAGFLAGTTYSVRTRTGNYPNMILAAMPHEERPEDWESVPLFLTFQELQTAGATYSPLAPRRRSDTKTVDKGQQDSPSVLKQAANAITAKVKSWN